MMKMAIWTSEPPAAGRAAEIGVVVSLLTRADDDTLREIRRMLENTIG